MGSMPSFTAKNKIIDHRLRPESSAANAWNLNLNDGNMNNNTKTQNQRLVRPVSAYCKETYHNKNNKKDSNGNIREYI